MKMIDAQSQAHAVELLRELTQIQSSSYYRWKKGLFQADEALRMSS